MFIMVAALLWLIIKLSDTYTVTVPFAIHYVDIPASQLVQDNDEEVRVTVTTTGFKLLNYYFRSKKHRKINISLKDTKYKAHEHDVYSYNSKLVAEKIGEYMASNAGDISISDDVQYFTMSRLASKKVRVIPETNLIFDQQYNYYGDPSATPDSITIYGSVDDVSGTDEIKTKVISRKNVNKSIVTKAKIDINDKLKTDVNEVEVSVNVEKYTESEVVVPITIPADLQMHLYPNKVTVRYIVAMKDYAIINNLSFKAVVDTNNMFFNDVLPVKMELRPNNIQIISLNPKEVEYIIVQQ